MFISKQSYIIKKLLKAECFAYRIFFPYHCRVNNHGVVKTFTVRYKCCYGFQREDNSPGCTKQVDLKPLLETIEEVDGKEFTNMISSSGLANKVKTENLTIFVPHDAALSEFNENMVDMVGTDKSKENIFEKTYIS